jgi:hypothetical protein
MGMHGSMVGAQLSSHSQPHLKNKSLSMAMLDESRVLLSCLLAGPELVGLHACMHAHAALVHALMQGAASTNQVFEQYMSALDGDDTGRCVCISQAQCVVRW